MSSVTILGTGRMGAAMAEMVANAGHDVTLWNRTPARARAIADRLGCDVAATPAAAVRGSDVVLSVLADGPTTTGVLLDPDVMDGLGAGSVTCDMATSGPVAALDVARAFEGRGLAFVDSPVAGSVASVLNSALLVMASGPEEAVGRATTIFGAFAREVVFLGAAGSGQAMKLCAGLVVHTLNSAVAEGLALATRAGIDPALAYDVFAGSSVGAPYLTYKREVFLGTDAPVAMALDLSGKDLALILDYARDRGLTLPVLSGVVDEVSAARARGYGSSDMADVVRFVLGEDAPARPHP